MMHIITAKHKIQREQNFIWNSLESTLAQMEIRIYLTVWFKCNRISALCFRFATQLDVDPPVILSHHCTKGEKQRDHHQFIANTTEEEIKGGAPEPGTCEPCIQILCNDGITVTQTIGKNKEK